jgi:hypothetical protein
MRFFKKTRAVQIGYLIGFGRGEISSLKNVMAKIFAVLILPSASN